MTTIGLCGCSVCAQGQTRNWLNRGIFPGFPFLRAQGAQLHYFSRRRGNSHRVGSSTSALFSDENGQELETVQALDHRKAQYNRPRASPALPSHRAKTAQISHILAQLSRYDRLFIRSVLPKAKLRFATPEARERHGCRSCSSESSVVLGIFPCQLRMCFDLI